MLHKIHGARRIRLNGEEYYVMTVESARPVFPDCEYEDGIDDDTTHYKDSTLVIISGSEENMASICASSDELNGKSVTVLAQYGENQRLFDAHCKWEDYCLPPIIVAISERMSTEENLHLFEDDHKKTHPPIRLSDSGIQGFLDYVVVSRVAKEVLHVRKATEILLNGISNYFEAIGDEYFEMPTVTPWGEGEEGVQESMNQPQYSHCVPQKISFSHNNICCLIDALIDPQWRDVPYIKLFQEHKELLSGDYE